MKVLSIDPGIRTTGFSVIEAFGPNVRLEAYGTIKPQIKDSTAKRLHHIFEEIWMHHFTIKSLVDIEND